MTFPEYVQPGELTSKPTDTSHARYTRKDKQMKAAFQSPNFDSFYDSELCLQVALSAVYHKATNYTGYCPKSEQRATFWGRTLFVLRCLRGQLPE
mgnify:FL=1